MGIDPRASPLRPGPKRGVVDRGCHRETNKTENPDHHPHGNSVPLEKKPVVGIFLSGAQSGILFGVLVSFEATMYRFVDPSAQIDRWNNAY